jgi:hypothetical protein
LELLFGWCVKSGGVEFAGRSFTRGQYKYGETIAALGLRGVLTVYFGAPSMFITLWFGFDYGTNPPLGTLII